MVACAEQYVGLQNRRPQGHAPAHLRLHGLDRTADLRIAEAVQPHARRLGQERLQRPATGKRKQLGRRPGRTACSPCRQLAGHAQAGAQPHKLNRGALPASQSAGAASSAADPSTPAAGGERGRCLLRARRRRVLTRASCPRGRGPVGSAAGPRGALNAACRQRAGTSQATIWTGVRPQPKQRKLD